MKRWVALAVILLASFQGIAHDPQRRPMPVSIVQLLANPEKYDGKQVSVIAFLSLDWEGDLLYSHKEDYDHVIQANALWLERTKQIYENREKLEMNYVAVVGVFQTAKGTHPASLVGGITNVKSCDLWSELNRPLANRIKEMTKQPAKP